MIFFTVTSPTIKHPPLIPTCFLFILFVPVQYISYIRRKKRVLQFCNSFFSVQFSTNAVCLLHKSIFINYLSGSIASLPPPSILPCCVHLIIYLYSVPFPRMLLSQPSFLLPIPSYKNNPVVIPILHNYCSTNTTITAFLQLSHSDHNLYPNDLSSWCYFPTSTAWSLSTSPLIYPVQKALITSSHFLCYNLSYWPRA